MTEGGTPELSEDPFVIAVRQYILDTLSPLIPTGEQTGRFMYGLLRRALRSASKEDLEQVVLHCLSFTDGLRANGFITEELARQAQTYLNPGAIHDAIGHGDTDTTDWSALPGQSAPDWTDQERQEHFGETSDSELSGHDAPGDGEGLATPTGLGGGHQATVEGDDDTNGEVNAEVVQEDGAG